jgi:DNA-binding MarR family transcriptional regulator
MTHPPAATFEYLEQPDDSIGYHLWQAHHRWQRFLEAALREVDLTHAQYVVLALIHYFEISGTPPSQYQVADRAGFPRMMVSTVVRVLVRKALIERHQSVRDGRADVLSLTKSGLKTLDRARRIAVQSQTRFFAPLGKGLARFEEMLRVLSGRGS